MDNNDSNIKSQQTGGLKLMTVFIAVLALHVVVIGGFTVYHLMSGGTSDADLTTTDKNHKGLNGSATTDGTAADASQNDKSTSTPTPPTEVATIPASTVTPATAPAPTGDTVSPSVASAPATTPAPVSSASAPVPSASPAMTSVQPAPAPAPTAETPSAQTPTGPISPDLAPPAEPTPGAAEPMTPEVAPAAASLATGPVHMPPANRDASRIDRMHEQIYVVKITDSYKKIAHRHHVTVAQLKEANHIKGDVLHTGQKLFIPSEKSEVAENAPTSALSSIPTASVSESAAPMTTGLTSSSTTTTTSGLHHHFYTVVKGDTLTKIAHRFKTTPSAIMAENGITDPTRLSIGKKLRIPSRDSRSASNGGPASTPPSQVQAKGNGNAASAQLANYAQ
jgi:LysM repeat protein